MPPNNLHGYAYRKEWTEVKNLLNKGANPDSAGTTGNTAAHYAAMAGQLDILKLLRSKGGNLLLASKDGATPLHWAAGKRHFEVVKYLLRIGANLEAVSDMGTPLCYVVQDCPEMLEYLLKRQAKPNIMFNGERTPLGDRVASGNLAQAETLIKAGADPKVGKALLIFRSRSLPLIIVAAANGHLSLCKLLVNAGASITVKDNEGYTAIDYAKVFNHPQVEKYLLSLA